MQQPAVSIPNSDIVELDDDIECTEVDDIDVADPSQFPAWKEEKPNKTIDAERYNEFEMAKEREKLMVETLNPNEVFHVRTAPQANRRCDEIMRAAKKKSTAVSSWDSIRKRRTRCGSSLFE